MDYQTLTAKSSEFLWFLLVSCFAALAPIHPILLTVGVLIVSDTILGVWAAKRMRVPITSARLRDTVSKMFIYHIVLVSGFCVEHTLIDFVPIVKISASMIALVELKSLYENAGMILGRPIFAELIKRLGSKNRE